MVSAFRVKFWQGILLSAAIAAGCSGTPQVVRSEADIDEGQALLILGVDVEGGTGPVGVGFDREPFLGLGMFRSDLTLRQRPVADPSEAALGELFALAIPLEPVRVGVVRVGEYRNFAGGRLEQKLDPRAGVAYYLGRVVIAYEEGKSFDMTYHEYDGNVARTLPRSPADVPPRTRYLLSVMKIINDEKEALRLLEDRFQMPAGRLENRTAFWDRMDDGGFLRGRQARPVQVITPQAPSEPASQEAPAAAEEKAP
jgi:hypothetical protein